MSLKSAAEPVSTVKREPVHMKCVEKLTAVLTRDGVLESCEVRLLTLSSIK